MSFSGSTYVDVGKTIELRENFFSGDTDNYGVRPLIEGSGIELVSSVTKQIEGRDLYFEQVLIFKTVKPGKCRINIFAGLLDFDPSQGNLLNSYSYIVGPSNYKPLSLFSIALLVFILVFGLILISLSLTTNRFKWRILSWD